MITSFATRVLLCAVLTASMNKPVERCEHGIKCYRKDKSHFKKFSHPVTHQWFLDGKDGISYDDAIETLKALPPQQTVATQDEAEQRRLQDKQAEELRSHNDLVAQQKAEAAALLVQKGKDDQLRSEKAQRDEQLRIQQDQKDALRAKEENDAALRIQQEVRRVQQEARDNQARIDEENRLRLHAAEEASQLPIQKEEKAAQASTATARLVADGATQDHTAQANQLPTKDDVAEPDQLPTPMLCRLRQFTPIPCEAPKLIIPATQDHTAQDDHLQTQGDAAQADQLPTQETTLCLIGRSLGMPCAQAELPTQDHTAQPDPLPTEEEFNTCDSTCQRDFLLKRVEAEIDEMSHDKLVVHARKQCHDEQCRDEIDSGDHARDLKQLVKDHMKTIVKHASEAGIQHVYKFDGLSAEEQKAA